MTVHGIPCNRACRSVPTARRARRKPGPPEAPKGFTIVEILVAIVLTAFGILGFAGLLEVMGSVEAEETWRAKALFCAQEQMEEITFALLAGEGTVTEGKEDLADGTYPGMRREWAVRDSGLLDGLLEVQVECAYPWKGARKSVALSTLVFPGDGKS